MHEADHAGGSAHVALHVLHPGGRLDRDSARVETDALADHGDWLASLRAGAVPAHGDEAAVARGPAAYAEQRVHAQLSHRLLIEDVHLDSEALQPLGAIGEFGGKEHVRRLVDEVAGDLYAFGHGHSLVPGRAGRRRMARADDELWRTVALLVRLLLARLVFVETIASQPQSEPEIRGRRAIPRPRRRLEGDLHLLRSGELAEHKPTEHDQIERRVVLARSDADDQ